MYGDSSADCFTDRSAGACSWCFRLRRHSTGDDSTQDRCVDVRSQPRVISCHLCRTHWTYSSRCLKTCEKFAANCTLIIHQLSLHTNSGRRHNIGRYKITCTEPEPPPPGVPYSNRRIFRHWFSGWEKQLPRKERRTTGISTRIEDRTAMSAICPRTTSSDVLKALQTVGATRLRWIDIYSPRRDPR